MRTVNDEYLLRVREIALAQCRCDAGRDPDPRTTATAERAALDEAA